MPKVIVDKDACEGTGICMDVCPMNVYDMVDDKAEPNREEDCIICMACVTSCPNQAITIEE